MMRADNQTRRTNPVPAVAGAGIRVFVDILLAAALAVLAGWVILCTLVVGSTLFALAR